MRNDEIPGRDRGRERLSIERNDASFPDVEQSGDQESVWSKVAREANLLSDSTARGISDSLYEFVANPGKAVIASGLGFAMSAPLLVLSCRYRALRPLADIIGIGGSACFAGSEIKKLGGIGSALTNYWEHPESKLDVERAVALNSGSLFADVVATGCGLGLGARYGSRVLSPLGQLSERYGKRLVRLKELIVPQKSKIKPEWPDLEIRVGRDK